MDPLLLSLVSHSHPWRTLYIDLDAKDAPTLSLIRGSLPLLELLHVHCIDGPLNETDCFEFAPRLRTLAISGDVMDDRVSLPLIMPRCQITHFIYDQPTSDAVLLCRNIIAVLGVDNLQTCRLPFDSKSISRFLKLRNDPAKLVLRLSCLTELELNHNEEKSGVEATLSWIKTHRLRNLTIFSTGPTRVPFVDFFTKSVPSKRTPPSPTLLRSLTIQRVEMSAVEYTAVLTLLMGLESLTFGLHNGITSDYLQPFCDTASDSSSFSIVPKLQNLSLLRTPGVESQYDNDILADLLERRWKGPLGVPEFPASSPSSQQSNRLVSIELDRKITSESVQSRLHQLRGEGMHIRECI
ncbi:hypothetical protein L218DRAFT_1005792 [Marasmius fiardii PR-910]|nr:hypothetical protein L218DRAFT_1005792 [Marasmius fiardii PR-910]